MTKITGVHVRNYYKIQTESQDITTTASFFREMLQLVLVLIILLALLTQLQDKDYGSKVIMLVEDEDSFYH